MLNDVMVKQLRKGERIAREEENGLVVLKCLNGCDVILLTTNHSMVIISSKVNNDGENTSSSRKKDKYEK